MVHAVVVNIILHTPDKSSFLILFLKALKDPIVLCESGKEFQSFSAVNHHDLRP